MDLVLPKELTERLHTLAEEVLPLHGAQAERCPPPAGPFFYTRGYRREYFPIDPVSFWWSQDAQEWCRTMYRNIKAMGLQPWTITETVYEHGPGHPLDHGDVVFGIRMDTTDAARDEAVRILQRNRMARFPLWLPDDVSLDCRRAVYRARDAKSLQRKVQS